MKVEAPNDNLPKQENLATVSSFGGPRLTTAKAVDSSERPLLRLQRQASPYARAKIAERRNGALLMAGAALASLIFRRMGYDSGLFVLLELILAGLLILLVGRMSIAIATTVLLVSPWLLDIAARASGAGNGKEILMLSSLAWGAVACAVFGKTKRTIGLSVVCSGFLTLFVTFISDTLQASWFAYAWGIVCLWWLISNHWEEVQSQAATQVQPMRGYRLISLALGCLVFAALTFAMANRVPVLRKFQQGIMPTSGGAGQKDSVGRGVGNGDALVAAQNNPSSFGAVDTDIFLESIKPSLFDVVSEETGFPKRARRVERAQSLQGSDARTKAGRFSEANQSGGGEFSTSRQAPKLREKPQDIIKESLMFWAGRPYAHLAVQRYARFDGVAWFNSEPDAFQTQPSDVNSAQVSDGKKGATPETTIIDDQTWFFPSSRAFPNDQNPYVDASAETLKFTRFRSPVIPARLGLQMWSIDMLDRADFFAIDRNDLVFMPDRLHVPDYTVVRMVGSKIDLEQVERLLACTPSSSVRLFSETSLTPELADSQAREVEKIATELSLDRPRGWAQVSAVVSGFRERFEPDRDWVPPIPEEQQSPVEQFLKSGRGPAHLIASATALVLRQLGYETRLAVGFYANPKNAIKGDGEIAILPSDSHFWVELHVGNGYWISLEPTDGYYPERMTVGLWYRLKQVKNEIAAAVGSLAVIGVLVTIWRGYVLEFLSVLLWPIVNLVSDRRRVAWLARLLDLRARFAGHPRSHSMVMRKHFDSLVGSASEDLLNDWRRFLSASDRLVFGGQPGLTRDERLAARNVWKRMTFYRFRKANPSKDDLR